jgi:hypothetical protein
MITYFVVLSRHPERRPEALAKSDQLETRAHREAAQDADEAFQVVAGTMRQFPLPSSLKLPPLVCSSRASPFLAPISAQRACPLLSQSQSLDPSPRHFTHWSSWTLRCP